MPIHEKDANLVRTVQRYAETLPPKERDAFYEALGHCFSDLYSSLRRSYPDNREEVKERLNYLGFSFTVKVGHSGDVQES